jgi:uncharacterized protein YecT (DUF1311 family)
MIAALLLALAQPAENPHNFQCDNPRDEEEAALCKELHTPQVADEPPEPDDDCDDPQAQQRMNFCASLEFGAADAALNEQWAESVAAAKLSDVEIDREHDQQPGHYETLLEAQRAWLKFRDAHCLMESFEARGGSMQPMLEHFCMTYLTELRTEQLRNIAAGPEGE